MALPFLVRCAIGLGALEMNFEYCLYDDLSSTQKMVNLKILIRRHSETQINYHNICKINGELFTCQKKR